MFSLIPHKSGKPQARHQRLISPGDQPICCWGEERLQLQISGRLFMGTFIKAEVTFPILGWISYEPTASQCQWRQTN